MATVAILCLTAGFLAGRLFHPIDARNNPTPRSSPDPGLDPESAKRLTLLTDDQLSARALAVARGTRDLCFAFQAREEPHRALLTSGDEASITHAREQLQSAAVTISRRYNTIRVARELMHQEMRRRIDPETAASIAQIPLLESQDPIIAAHLMCAAADETEQLANLLETKH